MKNHAEKKLFSEINRYVKISYFVSSIIPLSLLTFITVRYVYPSLGFSYFFLVLLSFSTIISLLGLILLSRTTNKSITSIQSLYNGLYSLNDISKQFRKTYHLDILLDSIIASAKEINASEKASLLLVDEAGDLRFSVLSGETGQKLKGIVVKKGEGFSGWVADTSEPVMVNDVSQDSRYNPDLDRRTGFKTRSVLCVPVINNEEFIGVIEVLNKKNGLFLDQDMVLLSSLADNAAVSIANTRIYEKQHSDIMHLADFLVKAQNNHCPDKVGHVKRVAHYTNIIGRQMGLSEQDLKDLYYASIFHDVGFLLIPSCHSDEAMKFNEIYKQHPKLGYEIIKPINAWSKAADLILMHHERYDGKGYPFGKKQNEIPLGARILFLAEVFDILTSKLSYKSAIDYDKAVIEIEANSGTQFDPAVAAAFKTSIKNTDMHNI
jgi:hypothetical protein